MLATDKIKLELIKRNNFSSSEIIDLLASHDTLLKKITCDYLADKSSVDSSLSLLTANILLRDTNDANPAIRSASLVSLSNLSGMEEAALSAVSKAMNDSSPQVRRSAAHCCINIYKHSPEALLSSGLVDSLYENIRDSDPIVVTNCLLALEKVLRNEGKLVINKNIVHYLLERLPQFSECNMIYILNLLTNYVPKNEEEMFEILNELDSCFSTSNAPLLLSAIQLFVHLTKDFPNLIEELYATVKVPFCKALSQSRPETCYLLIDFLYNAPYDFRTTFRGEYKYFLVKTKDPNYLKEKKFKILPLLARKENILDIISDVKEYTSDFQSFKEAFECLALLGAFDDESELLVFSFLSHIFKNSNDLVSEAALQSLLSIILKKTESEEAVSPLTTLSFPDGLCDNFSSVIMRPGIQERNPELVLHSLQFLIPYLNNIQELFEDLAKQVTSWDLNTRCLFVTCSCVAFLHKPAVMQPVLSSILSRCLKAPEETLSSHTAFVYAALEEGPIDAFKILSLSRYFPSLHLVNEVE